MPTPGTGEAGSGKNEVGTGKGWLGFQPRLVVVVVPLRLVSACNEAARARRQRAAKSRALRIRKVTPMVCMLHTHPAGQRSGQPRPVLFPGLPAYVPGRQGAHVSVAAS